jgi:hypothetical protein
MKSTNTFRPRNDRTSIRTGALLRLGDFLRAGSGFSPIIRIRTDAAGTRLRIRLKCGVDRLIHHHESVVIRASRTAQRLRVTL